MKEEIWVLINNYTKSKSKSKLLQRDRWVELFVGGIIISIFSFSNFKSFLCFSAQVYFFFSFTKWLTPHI